MTHWEYCILSGIETAMKKRMSLYLTFSSSEHENQNLEIKLDSNSSEEILMTQYLGELGRQGWEVVAFNRAAPKFEAVLKRPMVFDQPPLGIASDMH